MANPEAGDLIEQLYASLREAGGQQSQLDRALGNDAIIRAFAATVADLSSERTAGPFYPRGLRTPLVELRQRRAEEANRIVDTEHVQAMLWAPPRWRVLDRPDLDFHFLARELTPLSSVAGPNRHWVRDETQRRISLDALLVNADDRTPIVAEIKVGGDENAELALVQALAAAAQLSTPSQLRRLHREYRDELGPLVPSRLDVYVVTARAPSRGTRPELARRAHKRARELEESGALSQWIRRIVFLEATLTAGDLTFDICEDPQ